MRKAYADEKKDQSKRPSQKKGKFNKDLGLLCHGKTLFWKRRGQTNLP